MIPASFEYYRPSKVEDAITSLTAAGDEGKLLAGGQSLLPVLRLRMAAPTLLVDLAGLEQLRGIRDEADTLVIGAMTTHATLASDPLVAQAAPLLARAAATVGDRQVRHRGTIGGSLAHADPAGDLPSAAVALDASLVLAGPDGLRTVAAKDFFTDLFTTALRPDELVVEVRVPRLDGWKVHYAKMSRTAQAWATVAVAVAVRTDNGSAVEAKVALTSMGPTPVRAAAVESAIAAGEGIDAAAARAAEGASPASDTTASAEFRGHLARVLTRRALTAALAS